MTREELLVKLEDVLETGGEAALERYMIDNFEDLPRDVQGKVLMGFVSETVNGSAAIEDIQQEGLAAIKVIEALQTELQNEGVK